MKTQYATAVSIDGFIADRHDIHASRDQPESWPHTQPCRVFRAWRETTSESWGGGDLAAQFFAAGLLDEIILTIAPVILCACAPLFTRQIVHPPLQRTAVKPLPNGLTEIRLRVQAARELP